MELRGAEVGCHDEHRPGNAERSEASVPIRNSGLTIWQFGGDDGQDNDGNDARENVRRAPSRDGAEERNQEAERHQRTAKEGSCSALLALVPLASRVRQVPLIEARQEEIEHLRVSLLNLVQQHHAPVLRQPQKLLLSGFESVTAKYLREKNLREKKPDRKIPERSPKSLLVLQETRGLLESSPWMLSARDVRP